MVLCFPCVLIQNYDQLVIQMELLTMNSITTGIERTVHEG